MNIFDKAARHRQEFIAKASPENFALYQLSDGLEILQWTQDLMAEKARSAGETPIEEFRVYMLALIVELSELLQELPWKPWKPGDTSSATAEEKFRIADEFADVLAFLGHLIRLLDELYDIGPFDLAKAYKAKSQVNLDRFEGLVEEYRFSEKD